MSDLEEENDLQYSVVIEGDEGNEYPYLNVPDCVATATFGNNGDTYTGEYKNGKRHGKGEYKFASGAKYVGDYKAGLKDGMGVFTAPDGGQYSGEWKDDKREGKGTYYYPSGDRYSGQWKNGAKHGTGTYTYANKGTSVTGTWSNGVLTYATWDRPDKSRYIGKFALNRPAGAGCFIFQNNNTLTGSYLPGTRWGNDNFVAPKPGTQPPKPIKPAALKKATRLLDKSVLKLDVVEGIFRLETPANVDGVPNFRQAQDYPVFGSGQPSVSGIRQLVEKLGDDDFGSIAFINLRPEPIVYIEDLSFVPRDRRELNESLNLGNITNAELVSLEERLMNKIRTDCKLSGNLVTYSEDIAAENPAQRRNVTKMMEVKEVEDDEGVKSLAGIRDVKTLFSYLEEEEELPVQYNRLPISDEKTPAIADIDAFVEIAKEIDVSTAFYFNCSMGKGRTTTAMVIGALWKKMQGAGPEPEEEDEPEEPSDEEADEDGEVKEKVEVKAQVEEFEADLSKGEYNIILELVKALGDGGKQMKEEIDDIIDRCGHAINLRECILYTKEMHDQETESRKPFWQRMSVNFLERYFMLFLYNIYFKQGAESEYEIPFSEWIQEPEQVELLEILGTRTSGPLSTFNWQ